MNKLYFFTLCLIAFNATANTSLATDPKLDHLVPSGHVIVDAIYGDLNNNNVDDVVLMIKGTDESNLVVDEYRGSLDLNTRGIVVALWNGDNYEVVSTNTHCFHSEDEYGGVYYPPEISLSIDKGRLFIHYAHGRYGYWRYNFRLAGDDFELIGYDSSSNRGPIVESQRSINFLTNKMLVKTNINTSDDPYREVFKESWSDFNLENRFTLSTIPEFGGYYASGLSELIQ